MTPPVVEAVVAMTDVVSQELAETGRVWKGQIRGRAKLIKTTDRDGNIVGFATHGQLLQGLVEQGSVIVGVKRPKIGECIDCGFPFVIAKVGKIGVRCKGCRIELRREVKSEKQRKLRAANAEKFREAKRKYREANLEKEREKGRKRHAANPEKKRESARKYRAANPEKVREKEREKGRKYHAANPEKIREAKRKRRADNPEKEREKARKRRAANPEKARENAREWARKRREKKERSDEVEPE